MCCNVTANNKIRLVHIWGFCILLYCIFFEHLKSVISITCRVYKQAASIRQWLNVLEDHWLTLTNQIHSTSPGLRTNRHRIVWNFVIKITHALDTVLMRQCEPGSNVGLNIRITVHTDATHSLLTQLISGITMITSCDYHKKKKNKRNTVFELKPFEINLWEHFLWQLRLHRVW